MKKTYNLITEQKFIISGIDKYTIFFTNGYQLSTGYEKDYIEYNLADLTVLYHEKLLGKGLKISIDENNSGFTLNDIFIPCYSIQDGYYTTLMHIEVYDEMDDLVLRVKTFGGEVSE